VSQDTTSCQLRVLSGWHQGAFVDLPVAVGEWSVGTQETNDVVLRDAPFDQAQLLWGAHSWRLQADNTSLELPLGHSLACGELRLTVVSPDASWTPEKEQTWPTPSPDPALSKGEDTAQEVATTNSPNTNTEASAPSDTLAHPKTAWLQSTLKNRTARLALLSMGSLLIVVAVVAMTQRHRPSLPPPPSSTLQVPESPAIDIDQLQAVVEAAGLGDVVRIEIANGQRYALRGVVQTQEQLENLMRDVMTLTRKVIPHLLVQNEFEAHVQSLQPLLPPDIQITAGAAGRVWLSSASQDPTALQEAIATVQRELPETVAIRNGLAPVQSAAVVATQAAGLPPIIALQGGPQSYVLLASGERVLPGGMLKNMRLLSVENQALVLEGPDGQIQKVER
jgi:hypothetical protein